MTNGRTSRLARLHRQMVERAETQDEEIAGLRAKLADATNDVDRLTGDLRMTLDRLERLEAAQEPARVGYRGRRFA